MQKAFWYNNALAEEYNISSGVLPKLATYKADGAYFFSSCK